MHELMNTSAYWIGLGRVLDCSVSQVQSKLEGWSGLLFTFVRVRVNRPVLELKCLS